MIAQLVLLLAMSLPVGAQPLLAHDWYTGLTNSRGQNCCGGRDCAPVPAGMVRALPDGTLEMLIGVTWRPVPPESVLFNIGSPDGRMHACVVGDEVRCLIMPAEL
jgi:hypothetical protein